MVEAAKPFIDYDSYICYKWNSRTQRVLQQLKDLHGLGLSESEIIVRTHKKCEPIERYSKWCAYWLNRIDNIRKSKKTSTD